MREVPSDGCFGFLQPLRIVFLLARLASAGSAARIAARSLLRLVGRPGFGSILGVVGALISVLTLWVAFEGGLAWRRGGVQSDEPAEMN